MNTRITLRIALYAVIASVPVLMDGLKPDMTTLDIVKVSLGAFLSACVAVRAFVDTTVSQENAKV